MPVEKLKLGAQLFTIRDFMKNEKDFAESMEKIAKIGYKYVQVSGIGDVSPKAIKEATEANGLQVVLTHTSGQRMLTETEKVIEEHDLFGCNGLGIGIIFGAEKTYDGYLKFCDNIKGMVEKIKKSGKVFLYHNHRYEFQQYKDGKTALEIIMENTDPDGVKLTLDTYWAQSGGCDSAEFIKKYSNRIFATHHKDMTVENNEIVIAEVMTGNMNFKRIFKVSAKHDVIWHFIELDNVKGNPFDSLKVSYDNVMATGMFE